MLPSLASMRQSLQRFSKSFTTFGIELRCCEGGPGGTPLKFGSRSSTRFSFELPPTSAEGLHHSCTLQLFLLVDSRVLRVGSTHQVSWKQIAASELPVQTCCEQLCVAQNLACFICRGSIVCCFYMLSIILVVFLTTTSLRQPIPHRPPRGVSD